MSPKSADNKPSLHPWVPFSSWRWVFLLLDGYGQMDIDVYDTVDVNGYRCVYEWMWNDVDGGWT